MTGRGRTGASRAPGRGQNNNNRPRRGSGTGNHRQSQQSNPTSSAGRPKQLQPPPPSLPKRPTSSQGNKSDPSSTNRPSTNVSNPLKTISSSSNNDSHRRRRSSQQEPAKRSTVGPTKQPRPAADDGFSRAEIRARALEHFRRMAWEIEIQGIQRIEGPLKDPSSSSGGIKEVSIAPPPVPRGGPGATPTNVITLDDDDDDDDDDGNNNDTAPTAAAAAASKAVRDTDPPEFYLGGSVSTARRNRLLRYQQRSVSVGRYPSPQAGIRIDLARLHRALAGSEGEATAALPTEASISNEYQRQVFRDDAPLTFDKAITTNWLKESGTLYRGFPLVERTVFFAADNFAGLQSNCFFKAVAYQVYGSRSFDARVKAEHLQYFSDVLKWPVHPRHEMYTKLNEWFYESYVSQPQGQRGSDMIELAANFYQLLTIPNCYIPMDMFEVTADLYNLFIVIYILDENDVVTEMTTKGSYNARHIFMLYRCKHFQPMVPNDYYASEFQLPRVTYFSTRNYPLTSARDKYTHTVDHVYRRRCRVTIDRKPGAPPVDVVFYKKTIDAVVNGKQLF